MRQSDEVKDLFKALVEARGEIQNLYPSSSGYGYDYVPLEKIIDMLKAVLPKHGLDWIQLPSQGTDNSSVGLTTRIFHESGQWVEDTVIVPATDVKGTNASQKLGASITYFRRYALCAAFGIAGDKDVDANDKAFPNSGVNQKELEEAIIKLEGFLNNGVLDKDIKQKKAAENLLKGTDIKRINACIDYCKKLEESA